MLCANLYICIPTFSWWSMIGGDVQWLRLEALKLLIHK